MLFAPVEVAVRPELQGVGMVQRVVREPARQFPDIETALDLLDLRRIMPENPVHPSIDPESKPFPLEQAAYLHLGLVGRIGLSPFLLHPEMDFPTFRGRTSEPRMGFNASPARRRQGEIAQGDGNEFHRNFHTSNAI